MNRFLLLAGLLAICFPLLCRQDSTRVPSPLPDSSSVSGHSAYLDSLVSADLTTLPSQEFKSTPTLDVLRYVFGLAIVFGMLFLFVILIRRFMGKGRFISNLDPSAKILDVCPLNPRLSLYIIRLFGEILVLGVSPDGIRLLYKITDQGQVEAISGRADLPPAEQFKNFLERWKKKTQP